MPASCVSGESPQIGLFFEENVRMVAIALGLVSGILFRPDAVPANFQVKGLESVHDPYDDKFTYRRGSIIQYADIVWAGYVSTHILVPVHLAPLDFRGGAVPYLEGVDLINCESFSGSIINVQELNGIFVASSVRFFSQIGGSSDQGILIKSTRSSGIVNLENIEVNGSFQEGIVIERARTARLVNCTVHGSSQATYVDRLILARNKFRSNDPFQSALRSSVKSTSTDECLAVENTFEVKHPSRAAAWSGVWASTGHRVEQNTFLYGHVDFTNRIYGIATNLTFVNNTVRHSTSGGLLFQGSFTVTNNTIQNCSTEHRVSSFALLELAADGGAMYFANNKILNSTGSYVASLYGRGRSPANHSLFVNNEVTGTTVLGEGLVEIKGYPWGGVERNIFNVPAPTAVEMRGVPTSVSLEKIRMSMNFWGGLTEDVISVRAKVRDGFHDTVSPLVEIKSILAEASFEGPVQPVDTPRGILSDGSLGGIVTNATLQLMANTNYTCSLALIVGKDGLLKVGEGVNIEFAPSIGLAVRDGGLIDFEGSSSSPVFLRNSTSSQWKGLVFETKQNLTVSHLTADFAETGLSVSGSGDLELFRVEFRSCQTGVLHAGSGNLDFLNSTVLKADDKCIFSSPAQLSGIFGVLSLRNARLERCGKGAVVVTRREVNILNSTVFMGNGLSLSVVKSFVMTGSRMERTTSTVTTPRNFWGEKFIIAENTFSRCAAGLVLKVGAESDVRVVDNVVQGDSVASEMIAHALFLDSGTGKIEIKGNEFLDWNLPRQAAVYVANKYNGHHANSIRGPRNILDLSENSFRNIRALNILSLHYRFLTEATNVANMFLNNLTATSDNEPSLFLITKWPRTLDPAKPTSLVGNLFTAELSRKTRQYYMQITDTESPTQEIDASKSYWNNDTAPLLFDRIFDGRESPASPTFIVSPYLLTPSREGPIASISIPFLDSDTQRLQGTLEPGKSVLLKEGNSYAAVSDLFIDGNLTIEKGASITFSTGSSLIIRNGSIVASGTTLYPVKLSFEGESHGGQVRITSSASDVVLRHIVMEGASQSSIPLLELHHPGEYEDIVVQSNNTGAVVIEGLGSFSCERFRILNRFGNAVSVRRGADVVLKDFIIEGSGSAGIYSNEQSRVRLLNTTFSRSAQYRYSLHTNNFTEVIGLESYSPILSGCRNCSFSLQNSTLTFRNIREKIGIRLGSWSRLASVLLQGNTISGFCPTSLLYIHAKNLTIRDNSIFDVKAGHLIHSITSYTSVLNNRMEDIICSRNCLHMNAFQGITARSNMLSTVTARPSRGIKRATVSVSSSLTEISRNRFVNCTSFVLLELRKAPDQKVSFEENTVAPSSSVSYFVSVSTPADDVVGGVHTIGSNYWGTSSYEMLYAKTYDSSRLVSLATVRYGPMYADESLQTTIPVPLMPILDAQRKTIGGAIVDNTTIVVPSGLYYASSPIVLRHPDAVLVLEAGVRIAFGPSASIRVDNGVLRILGSVEQRVTLASTDFYSQGSIVGENLLQDRWGGIFFAERANSSFFSGNYEYVRGSIFRHCNVISAGIQLHGASVFLDNVNIFGSPASGLHARNSMYPIVLRNTVIANSSLAGISISYPKEPVVIENVNVTDSGHAGLVLGNHNDVSVKSSSFSGNRDGQILSYGSLDESSFQISSCHLSGQRDGYGLRMWQSRAGVVRLDSVSFSSLTRPLKMILANASVASRVFVSRSTFERNTCVPYNCVDVATHGNITFEDNVVSNNTAGNVVRIRSYYYHKRGEKPSVDVKRNIFEHNHAMGDVKRGVLALGAGGESFWSINHNLFRDLSSRLEITTYGFTSAEASSVKVNATNNVFGSSSGTVDAALIDSRIYDDEEDPSLPEVFFSPFLPDAGVPSALPSVAPSATPSLQPSYVPSAFPSLRPSSAPSQEPSYSPSSLPTNSGTVTIDFEEFGLGAFVSELGDGVTVWGSRRNGRGKLLSRKNFAMIFDTAVATGSDYDLTLAGDIGNVLIIAENNEDIQTNPDDNQYGGLFIFRFSEPASSVMSVELLDIDSPGTFIRVKRADGILVDDILVPQGPNGSLQKVLINQSLVEEMEVNLSGPGAISMVTYAR